MSLLVVLAQPDDESIHHRRDAGTSLKSLYMRPGFDCHAWNRTVLLPTPKVL